MFSDPPVLMLQDLQRRLGVTLPRRVVEDQGHLALAVGAALQFRHLRYRVHLPEARVLGRQHACRQRQRVPAQAQPGGVVDLFKTRLGRL